MEDFYKKVFQMRFSQKEYFRLAGMARKNPALWDSARKILTQSKGLEAEVDQQLSSIIENTET